MTDLRHTRGELPASKIASSDQSQYQSPTRPREPGAGTLLASESYPYSSWRGQSGGVERISHTNPSSSPSLIRGHAQSPLPRDWPNRPAVSPVMLIKWFVDIVSTTW